MWVVLPEVELFFQIPAFQDFIFLISRDIIFYLVSRDPRGANPCKYMQDTRLPRNINIQDSLETLDIYTYIKLITRFHAIWEIEGLEATKNPYEIHNVFYAFYEFPEFSRI